MQRVTPSLMFVGDQLGKAEEAMDLYVSVFEDSEVLELERLDAEGPGAPGIKRARLRVAGQQLFVMDSPGAHQFTFNPAISLVVEFDGVDELDAAWAALSEGASVLMPLQAYDFSPRFGWLQDRFGVTWQLSLA